MSLFVKEDSIQIREVWNNNLESEMALIREVVDDYPFIGMVCRPVVDTEFPGIVCRPDTSIKTITEYNYQTLKANVDNTVKMIIQLGLTLSDENGNLPTCGNDKYCIWQFNIRDVDLNSDSSVPGSVELLQQPGIDLAENNQTGIDSNEFAKLMLSSGTVLNENVNWVTFHGGYDCGYLLKLLTGQNLPKTQKGFLQLISVYFPTVYDIKHLMKFCDIVRRDLNYLAELLDVERVGICHQAGSDSLFTSCTFRKLKENFFTGSMEKYSGLFGLGVET